MAQKTLQIEMRALESLIPYARNSRTHSEEQVGQIAASIAEFGWTNPVLVDGANGIIAGHGRVLAARKLGLSEVPCIELAHLTKAQRRAYIIADNKLAMNAGWDNQMLALEFEDLKTEEFDLALTGFDMKELQAIMATDDDLMEPREESESKLDAISKLVWEKKQVPLSEDEVQLLDKMYEQYIEENGVPYGFVRKTFGSVRS